MANSRSMTTNISVTKRQAEGVRASIKATNIANRLQDHVHGLVDMTPTQINAAKILLDRVVPILQAVHVEAGDGIDLVTLLTEARSRVLGDRAVVEDVVEVEGEVVGTEGEGDGK